MRSHFRGENPTNSPPIWWNGEDLQVHTTVDTIALSDPLRKTILDTSIDRHRGIWMYDFDPREEFDLKMMVDQSLASDQSQGESIMKKEEYEMKAIRAVHSIHV